MNSRSEKSVIYAGQRSFLVGVTRNLGRSVLKSAGLAQRVGQDVADVAQTAMSGRKLDPAKTRQLAADTQTFLKQIRSTADPREIGGGFVGLAAGDVVGRTVGGAVGAVVGGPAGLIVGSQVGGLTGAMLGLKAGTEGVRSLVEKQSAHSATPTTSEIAGNTASSGEQKKAVKVAEYVGLTSGASVGTLVAGPVGGAIAALVGDVLGGHVGQEAQAVKPTPTAAGQTQSATDAQHQHNHIQPRGKT